MKPTASKTTWMVWTNNQISGNAMTRDQWRWVATGPLGSDAGVAETADEAIGRAYGAGMVLSEAAGTQA